MIVVGRGFCFEDLKVGFRFRTHRRTIREADLAAFVGLTGLTEELFSVAQEKQLVPGALVYSFAEGLLLPTMQDTGLAFLNATLDVKAPTVVGDTIHVEAEVTEHRLTSKGDRGLVRFANKVIKVYPAFAEFYGMEDAIEQVVSYFRHAAQGLEEKKQILYLLGPVGGGKSSIAERLKQLMQEVPFFAPLVQPTLDTGTSALVVAALSYLGT